MPWISRLIAILSLLLPSISSAQELWTPVTFENVQSDLSLTGWLARPESSESAPAAIFLHGCSGPGRGGAVSSTYTEWARILTANGFAVLLVDSAGPRGFGATCGPQPERKTMYLERPGDAYAGLRYLQQRDDIDPERIYLIGWSQGGGITLLTMNSESIGRPEPAPRHDFRAAVAFYPAACSRHLQERPYTTVEPGTWRTIAPLLILQGADDNWTTAPPCEGFAGHLKSRGEPVEIVVYPDALHGFDAPNRPPRPLFSYRTASGEHPLVGTNAKARDAAIADLLAFLRRH